MLEQEVKILAIDTEKVVTKLLKYQAKRIFSGFITDTMFVHPEKQLDFSIRVRKKNAEYYLTFKKRLVSSGYKQALEIECKILQPEIFLQKLQQQ
jgi:predicted adenylyl cyclase CyaB